MRTPQPYTAIVLAGRGSARLGGIDKPMVDLAGSTLLDRVLEAVSSAVQITVVGPRRDTARTVTWREEQPPGGGPVAAFAAGLHEGDTEVVLLLASDLPFIGPAIPALRRALAPGIDVALLCGPDGRANYLAAAWRRSAAQSRLAEIRDPAGVPMRRMLDGLTLTEVADIGGWGFDCDTPEALEKARERQLGRVT